MKNFLLLTVFCFLIFSCSKDDNENSTTDIVGEWNWESSSGGIQGETLTPESTGESRTLKITPNSFKIYVEGNLTYDTPYEIKNDFSYIYSENREMIIPETGTRKIIELNGDALTLIDDCNDCYVVNYSRN